MKMPKFVLVAFFTFLAATGAYATIDATLQMQLGNATSATSDPNNHTHYLIQRPQYALDYNDTTHEPNWVAWDLTSGDVGSSGRGTFQVDTTLPTGFYEVLTTDYSGSGYDRGHMCPSADRTITVADNEQLFYMSNMIPQSPDNNQGVWANFEDYCRQQAAAGNEILITSGPSVFGGSTLTSGVAIPGYTWKIAVVVPLGPGTALSRITSATRIITVKIPNIAGVRSTPWQNFVTSVAQIEADTGFTFLTALPAPVAAALRTVVDGQSAVGSPVVTTQPSPQTTVVGGSVSFSVTATGNDPLTYQWFQDDNAITGATSATLTIPSVQATDVGSYYVVVTNGIGATTSNAAALVVTGLPPVVTTPPASQTLNAGANFTFAVTASGSPTLAYQWRKNTAPISGATNSIFSLTNVQAGDAGSYDVVVTNSVSSATSAAATLTVNPAAPTITGQPASRTASTGDTASFSVTAAGTNPLTYQWRKNTVPLTDGGIVSGSATATLLLTGVGAADSANYDVVVTNSLGSATSTAGVLTVNPPPPSTVFWNFGTAAALSADPTSGLTADITGGTVTQVNNNGTTPLLTTVSASTGGLSGGGNAGAATINGALNKATSTYFQFTLAPSTGKRLLATGLSFGSRSTNTGPSAYTVFTSVDNFTTPVASGALTVIGNPWVTYTTAFTTVTGNTGTPITFRLYGYNGTGATGSTAVWRIDDVKLTINAVFPPPVAPVVVSTTPADGATSVPIFTPITVTFNEAVTFTGTWFSINSAANGPMAATVTGGPTTYTITPPSNFANTDNITVTIFGAQVVDQASGAIHGAGNTTFAFTTEVFVPPTPPTVTTQPTPLTVNVGANASFSVAASGTPPLAYQWRKGGTPISGNSSALTSTLTLSAVTTADSGSYDCVVSNVAGSDVSQAANLIVNLVPPSVTSPPSGQMVAVGGSTTFTVAATGTGPFSYQWRKNGVALTDGGVVSGSQQSTLTLTGVSNTDSAVYDVVVTNALTSVTSSAATLAVTSVAPSVIYWDFTTASPTSGIPASVTGGAFTQGNNNGTTPLLTTTSASGTYTGASGGNNVGAAARVGPLSQNAAGSAYFEFTFTPDATHQFAATGISFGMRATGTGPQAYAIFSSVDNYTAPIATGAVLSDSVWRMTTPNFGGVTGALGSAVTFRLFGYNGSGSPSAGTANWRVDDVRLTAGLLALPPVVPVVATTAAANGDANVALTAPITVTFNEAVNVTGSTFTVTSAASGPVAATVSGGPTTFTLTPAASFAYGDTITVTISGSQVTEQATNTLTMAADYSFSFTTIPPTPPTITTSPTSQTATVGDTVTFNVAASGTAPFSYQWRKDGTAITANASATTDTLTLANITTADAANYDCVVTNQGGVATSDAAALTVNKLAATVTISGLAATFDGTQKIVTATTSPGGLAVTITYNGGATAPVNAGSYAVVGTIVDANYFGSVSGVLVINQATATVTLGSLSQSYTGSPLSATATTNPAGRTVVLTYDGNATAPTNVGINPEVGNVVDPNYTGSASGTLTISKGVATVTLGNLSQIYDGSAKSATATTNPAGLPVQITYNGSGTPPTNAGSYLVVATINSPNYTGSMTGTLTIGQTSATVTLDDLSQPYDGTPKSVTTTTNPAGLTVTVTYNGSATAPTYPGSYAVVATINDPNTTGSASGTLTITTTVLVRHGPTLNADVDGSVQVLLPESTTFNSNAGVSGDLLVPGTPTIQQNGHPTYGGTIDGSGSATPSNYTITLNSNAVLRHVVRRTDAITMPTLSAPPAPTGTRNVSLNRSSDSPGDFTTLRNLTLNSNVGQVVIPPGTYGTFVANSGSGFTLGVAGATTPVVYNLQGLTLNSNSQIQVVGPVIVNVASGVTLNSGMGASAHPHWLTLNVASGGLTLNSNVRFDGSVLAPSTTGTVTINSNSTINGEVICDRLTINSNGLVNDPDL